MIGRLLAALALVTFLAGCAVAPAGPRWHPYWHPHRVFVPHFRR